MTKYNVIRTWSRSPEHYAVAATYLTMEQAEAALDKFRTYDYSSDQYHIEIVEEKTKDLGKETEE